MVFDFEHVRKADPAVYELAVREARKQVEQIRLIPSENYASAAVLQALATPFANKYSEGYPAGAITRARSSSTSSRRWLSSRAKQLFGADHANVQPYSGSPANLAVYFALLKPGDRVMGLALPSGGHLTHGASVNFTGVYYESHPYTGNDGRLAGLRPDPRAGARGPAALIIARRHCLSPRLGLRRARRRSRGRWTPTSWPTSPTSTASSSARSTRTPSRTPTWSTSTTHKMLRGPRGGLHPLQGRAAEGRHRRGRAEAPEPPARPDRPRRLPRPPGRPAREPGRGPGGRAGRGLPGRTTPPTPGRSSGTRRRWPRG